MAFEIELEDGTVLELEDGEDPDVAEREYKRQVGIDKLKKENPKEYDPESNAFRAKYGAMGKTTTRLTNASAAERQKLLDAGLDPDKILRKGRGSTQVDVPDTQFRASIGSGMMRSYKGLVNLVLPDSMTPKWASDENIREMDERDEPLDEAGKIIGGVAATAPLSGGLGAGLRGATALSTASKAPALLTKALASAPTRAVLEGATQGAIYADPEEQGSGALIGAGMGGLLNRAGALGGRLTRGLVEKSPAAKAIEQTVGQHGDDIFIPLGQAANGEGNRTTQFMKTLYKEGLPFMPFAGGRIEGQLNKAREKLRETALKEALPSGGTLPPRAGTKVEEAVANIKDQFTKAYDDTIKSYSFNVAPTLKADLAALIKNSAGKNSQVNSQTTEKLATLGDDLFKKFSNGKGVIDGTNLVKLKEELSIAMRSMPRHEKDALLQVDKYIDDLVERELKIGNIPQNLADLKRWQELTPAWRAFLPVQKSATAAADKEGQFLFKTLAKRSKNSPEQKVIGQLGREVLDDKATKGTTLGRSLVGLALGGVGKYISPELAATTFAVGQGLSAKSTQKALMGDTKIQKLIADQLRKHPEIARRIGSLGRAGAVIETQEQ